MNYSESIDYIESLSKHSTYSLANIKEFLNYLNNPQNNYPSIHIGGTNGKGSSVKMLASLLADFNFTTGMFTGPHIHDWTQRYEINGQCISKEEFSRISSILKDLNYKLAQQNPEFLGLSWFEFLTAIAFYWFKERNIDVAVIEVGMGGRLDATNIITNVLATVITNTEFDHEHILGDTITKIAWEKAHIIKPHTHIITACNNDGLKVIKEFAQNNDAPILIIDPKTFKLKVVNGDHNFNLVYEQFLPLVNRHLRLMGLFQTTNCLGVLLALYIALTKLNINIVVDLPSFLAVIANSLSKITWPGRFQYLADQKILLDACHNISGAIALRKSLDFYFPKTKFIFIFACYFNKNPAGILKEILQPDDILIATQFKDKRLTYAPEELVIHARKFSPNLKSCSDIKEALSLSYKLLNDNQIIVAIGSFKVVKEVNECLVKKPDMVN